MALRIKMSRNIGNTDKMVKAEGLIVVIGFIQL